MKRSAFPAILALLFGAACHGSDSPAVVEISAASWAEDVELPPQQPCIPSPEGPALQIPVRPVVSTTSAPNAPRLFAGAQSYARSLNVELVPTSDIAVRIEQPSLSRSGDGAAEGETTADSITLLLRRVVGFLARLPRSEAVHVVFLERIVVDGSPMAEVLDSTDAMTISPFSPSELSWPIGIMLASHGFPPTVFLASTELASLDDDEAAALIVHEIGHALGLDHVEDQQRLMATQRAQHCRPSLTAEERQAVATNLSRLSL